MTTMQELEALPPLEHSLRVAALQGVQTPSIEIAHPYTSTRGPQVIAFATSFTGEPDDWQKHLHNLWASVDGGGKWLHPICGLAVPRQNGKSKSAEDRALFGALALGERVLWTAHLSSTASDVFNRMADRIRNTPALLRQTSVIRNANGQQELRFRGGGFIRFMTRTKNQARGQSFDLLIMDEAQDLSQFEWDALSPVVTASANGQTILLGTPPNLGSAGDFFLDYRARILAKHPKGQCWSEWSAKPLPNDTHLDQIEAWAQANPALGTRITFETLYQGRNSSAPDSFARERLGIFGTTVAGSVVPMDVFEALADDTSTPVDNICLAIDVSPDRSRSSVSICGINEAGVPHIEVIRTEAGTEWVVDYVVDVTARQDLRACIIDARSGATTFIDELKRRKVYVRVTHTSDMTNACGKFFDAVMQGAIAHIGQQHLTLSLANAAKRELAGGWAFTPKAKGADITAIVACTLALWGATTSKHLPRPVRSARVQRKTYAPMFS